LITLGAVSRIIYFGLKLNSSTRYLTAIPIAVTPFLSCIMSAYGLQIILWIDLHNTLRGTEMKFNIKRSRRLFYGLTIIIFVVNCLFLLGLKSSFQAIVISAFLILVTLGALVIAIGFLVLGPKSLYLLEKSSSATVHASKRIRFRRVTLFISTTGMTWIISFLYLIVFFIIFKANSNANLWIYAASGNRILEFVLALPMFGNYAVNVRNFYIKKSSEASLSLSDLSVVAVNSNSSNQES